MPKTFLFMDSGAKHNGIVNLAQALYGSWINASVNIGQALYGFRVTYIFCFCLVFVLGPTQPNMVYEYVSSQDTTFTPLSLKFSFPYETVSGHDTIQGPDWVYVGLIYG